MSPIKFGDRQWTHAEYFEESCRFAALFLERLPAGAPRHVAVLLDNTPDYLFAFGGAALIGGAVVGLNHTRRDEHLLRDAQYTDCGLVLTEPRHEALLAPIAEQLPPILSSDRFAEVDDGPAALGTPLATALAPHAGASDPGLDPDIDSIWALIFTSGTSDAPKAVICSQRRLLVTGKRMGMIMGLVPGDVGYVCMPLFHSSAVQVGWAPSLVTPCAVGLGRRFSASRWLADVRHYGATYSNYTGKPLAYLLAQPERPDDADNTLRVAFGNEGSPEVVDGFARRFGLEVIDAYGATEGGLAVNRDAGTPPGALGLAPDHVQVVDDDGNEKPRAELDEHGRVTNAEDCVGEIVNTQGAGRSRATTRTTTRPRRRRASAGTGRATSATRTRAASSTSRAATPTGSASTARTSRPARSKRRISGAPGVVIAAVYGVPDDQAGDQAMAGLVLADEATFDVDDFARWLDAQPAIGPKWRPRYVRILRDPPTTGTNKIVKRTLVHQKFRHDRTAGDPCFVRLRGEERYRPFTEADEHALHESFVQYGRERFWDL